jgi:hypothetical protein
MQSVQNQAVSVPPDDHPVPPNADDLPYSDGMPQERAAQAEEGRDEERRRADQAEERAHKAERRAADLEARLAEMERRLQEGRGPA